MGKQKVSPKKENLLIAQQIDARGVECSKELKGCCYVKPGWMGDWKNPIRVKLAHVVASHYPEDVVLQRFKHHFSTKTDDFLGDYEQNQLAVICFRYRFVISLTAKSFYEKLQNLEDLSIVLDVEDYVENAVRLIISYKFRTARLLLEHAAEKIAPENQDLRIYKLLSIALSKDESFSTMARLEKALHVLETIPEQVRPDAQVFAQKGSLLERIWRLNPTSKTSQELAISAFLTSSEIRWTMTEEEYIQKDAERQARRAKEIQQEREENKAELIALEQKRHGGKRADKNKHKHHEEFLSFAGSAEKDGGDTDGDGLGDLFEMQDDLDRKNDVDSYIATGDNGYGYGLVRAVLLYAAQCKEAQKSKRPLQLAQARSEVMKFLAFLRDAVRNHFFIDRATQKRHNRKNKNKVTNVKGPERFMYYNLIFATYGLGYKDDVTVKKVTKFLSFIAGSGTRGDLSRLVRVVDFANISLPLKEDRRTWHPVWRSLRELFQHSHSLPGSWQLSQPLLASMARGKVGLALSGGGLRASFVHLGLLARLAECDILRSVEVMSCVSGGSIVGALYYMMVKDLLEHKRDADIQKEDYIHLVKSLHYNFHRGMMRNMYNRTMISPFNNLKIQFLKKWFSRSTLMAEQFHKSFYGPNFKYRQGSCWFNLLGCGDGYKMKDVRLADQYITPLDFAECNNFNVNDPPQARFFNEQVCLRYHPSLGNWKRDAKVPAIFLNCTTLNTGHIWRFTVTNFGEKMSSASERKWDKNSLFTPVRYDKVKADGPAAYMRDISLAEAVSVSASVPGFFEPFQVTNLYTKFTPKLTDGGVIDNSGMVTLLEQRVDIVLCSDASMQMEDSQGFPDGFAVISRALDIRGDGIFEAAFQQVGEKEKANEVAHVAYIHLKQAQEGMPDDVTILVPMERSCKLQAIHKENPFEATEDFLNQDAKKLSKLDSIAIGKRLMDFWHNVAMFRTALDRFTEVECSTLLCMGYSLTCAQLLKLGKLAQAGGSPDDSVVKPDYDVNHIFPRELLMPKEDRYKLASEEGVAGIRAAAEKKFSEVKQHKGKGFFGAIKSAAKDMVADAMDIVEDQFNIDDSEMANLSAEDRKKLIEEQYKHNAERKRKLAIPVQDEQLEIENLESHWAYFSVDGSTDQDWVFFPMMKVFDSTDFANYGVRRLHVLLSESGNPFAVMRYLQHAKMSAMLLTLAILGGIGYFIYMSIVTASEFINEHDCNCFRDSPLYYLAVVVGLIIAFIKPGLITKFALAVGIQPLSAWTDIYVFSPYLLAHGKQSVVINLFHEFNQLIRLNKGKIPEGGLKAFKKLGKGLMNAATLGQLGGHNHNDDVQSEWTDPLRGMYKDFNDPEPKITYEEANLPRTSFFFGYPEIKIGRALLEFVVETPGVSHAVQDSEAETSDASDMFRVGNVSGADMKSGDEKSVMDQKHGDVPDVKHADVVVSATVKTVTIVEPETKHDEKDVPDDRPPAYPATPDSQSSKMVELEKLPQEDEEEHHHHKKKKTKKSKKKKKKKKHKKNKVAPKPVSSEDDQDEIKEA